MNREHEWLLNEKYDGISSPAFNEDAKRLEEGEPLAYVIGWIPFLGTRIFLDSRPLIPRPETEFWVAKAIEDIRSLGKSNPAILDLCAASGCIGIAILKAIPDTNVDFAEIDEAHHATIRKNISENGFPDRNTKIFGGDLFERISETYDAILTNPPYIDPNLSDRMQRSVADYEPALALFGGQKGMEIIERILREAPRFLKTGGILYMEHEPEQAAQIRTVLPDSEQHDDQYGITRFSVWKKN